MSPVTMHDCQLSSTLILVWPGLTDLLVYIGFLVVGVSQILIWSFLFNFSPNAGEDFFWLWDYNHESNITVFTSAEDGSYALLTHSQQV